MPETDAHIPGHVGRGVRRVLRAARRAARGRRDAARARGALLRRPGRGALPQRRDVFDRHEAAHQAGAGARARSRSAVPRRAHQRHGPEGPRRDAGADSRSGAEQGREPDCLVAPAARHRVHLRARGGDGQGRRGRAGHARRGEGPAGAGLRAAGQGRERTHGDAAARGRLPVPRHRRRRDARVRAGRYRRDRHLRARGGEWPAGAPPAAERADARRRLCARRGRATDVPIHDQGYQRYAGSRAHTGAGVAGDRQGRNPLGARRTQVPGAAAAVVGAVPRAGPCRSTSRPTSSRRRFSRPRARRSASSSRRRASSCSSSRSTSAPG